MIQIIKPVIAGGVIVIAVIAIIIELKGSLRRLRFFERLAVDHAGKLVIKKPGWFGYTLVWKIMGLQQELRTINILEYSINLHKEGEQVWIDLKEGGRVILINPKIWIKVENPEKAVGSAIEDGNLNFESLVRSMVATTISGHIRTLSVDEVMKITKQKDSALWDIIAQKESFQGLESDRGIKLCGITFDDIDFSEEVTRRRKEEYESIVGIRVQENKAKAEAHRILGSLVHLIAESRGITIDEAKAAINTPKMRQSIVDLYIDFKQRELSAVTDIRVSGKKKGEKVSDFKKDLFELISSFISPNINTSHNNKEDVS